MKAISADKIRKAVANLAVEANLVLRADVLAALKKAYLAEKSARAKNLLQAIIKNAQAAKKEKLAICQDTGMPLVFLELGSNVRIKGGLYSAVNHGIVDGYKRASLRSSIVQDPLARGNSTYGPAVIHTEIVPGSKFKITVLPKGFGSENKSQLKMFKPTAAPVEIKKFIVEAVKAAGPDACPPYIVGVGIGGTADYACLLSKKALLKKVRSPQTPPQSVADPPILLAGTVHRMEAELLKEINKLNIGPMGLGGKTTALAVSIATHPTHIAGLPVAVNISCHALRSASVSL